MIKLFMVLEIHYVKNLDCFPNNLFATFVFLLHQTQSLADSLDLTLPTNLDSILESEFILLQSWSYANMFFLQ